MILSNTLSLWFLLLLLPMIWVWRRSLVDHSRGLKLASFLLRLLAFGALVVALCRPYWPQANDRQHVIYLVDGSQSISPDSILQAQDWIQQSQESLRSSDTSQAFLFADGLQPLAPSALAEFAQQAQQGTTESDFRSGTRLAEALKAVRLVFPADGAKRLIVLSDGVATGAPVAPSLALLAQEQVEVFE